VKIKYVLICFLALLLLFSFGCEKKEEEEIPELPPFPETAPTSFNKVGGLITGKVVAEPVLVTQGVSVNPSSAEVGDEAENKIVV